MVLPVGDVNPTRRTPVVTVAFILANVVVFLFLQPSSGGCAEVAFLYRWAAVPSELLSLQPLGAPELRQVIGPCAAAVGTKSVLLSPLTAMFLHANLGHLFGNMLFLWVFGNNVEDRLGRARFVLFYAAGGIAATYAFAFLHAGELQPLLGASGAIAAILGAYLVMFPRARVHTYVPFPLYLLAAVIPGARLTGWFFIFAIVTLPAFLVLGLWFVLQLLSSASPVAGAGVAFEAHVAGFLAGVALTLFLDPGDRRALPPPIPVR